MWNPRWQPRNGCDLQKDYGQRRCEIQDGGQEMAVMVENFNNDNSGELGATWSWHKIHLIRCY